MTPSPPSFEALGLRPELLGGLARLGFERPTPIQASSIPSQLEGHDAVIQAETGTGKTLAYGLPLLNAIAGTPLRPRAMILVPTRELALQVRDVLREAARKWRPAIHALVGGEAIEPQLKLIDKGIAVLVGTPGRVHDLVRRDALMLKHCRTVVLDEADEMLLRGFKHDLDGILAALPTERQTVLVSATVGPEVQAYAEATMRKTEEKAPLQPATTAKTLTHHHVAVPKDGKLPILTKLLREEPGQAIVFVRLKEDTKRVAMRLRQAGLAAAYLNGDLPQANRNETMARFRDGLYRILVATDVASRGLDIPEVDLVVNYAVPPDVDQYVHRAGRSGRAGREGRAVTLSYREEVEALKRLRTGIPLEPLKIAPPRSGSDDHIRPWKPPVEAFEAPETPSKNPAAKPPRTKISRHLDWHEDRPDRRDRRKR
ncbi:DEAD/DEAH box helicase [bacterium]|nr:DEAD/DEAH box helicase [bacterium]